MHAPDTPSPLRAARCRRSACRAHDGHRVHHTLSRPSNSEGERMSRLVRFVDNVGMGGRNQHRVVEEDVGILIHSGGADAFWQLCHFIEGRDEAFCEVCGAEVK